MSENPFSGRRPYEGSNDPEGAEQLPGEHPLDEDDQAQQPPGRSGGNQSGHSSRAARGGQMSSEQGSGVPGSAASPSSGGPPDAASPSEAGEQGARG